MAVRAKGRAALRRLRAGDTSHENWQRIYRPIPDTAKHAFDVAVQSHEATLARLTGTAREVAELHAPVRVEYGAVCGGCDYGGWEAEAPTWPCRTAKLLRSAGRRNTGPQVHADPRRNR